MKLFKVSPYKKKTNSNIENNSDYQELDKNIENGITNREKVVEPIKEEKEKTKEYKVNNEEKVIEEDVETI